MEKWVQKRARSDLLRALLRVSLFERFYAHLKSDVIRLLASFFLMSILSTIFVHLFAERWRFSAPFQISKNSISATFPAHFPNRFPAQAPVIFSLSGGILRSRNSQSNPPHLPRHLLFQGYPSQAKPQSTPCTSSQLSALSGEIYGEILGGILVFLL